jgi:hypothetical protein
MVIVDIDSLEETGLTRLRRVPVVFAVIVDTLLMISSTVRVGYAIWV